MTEGSSTPAANSKDVRNIGEPVSAPLLAGMRTVLAVAYGEEQADAVRSALNGGLVSGLITHQSLARRLLFTGSDGVRSTDAKRR